MGHRFKRISSLVLSFSMLVSLGACASSKEKQEEKNCITVANTFLDASVNLDSKTIKKLDKELGVGKQFVTELKEIAGNKYVKAVMEKASYEIDEKSVEESKKKASCSVIVTMPDYEKAFDDAESFDDFKDNIAAQKEKKYIVRDDLELEFKIKDGEYSMDSETAGDFIEDLYDDMLERITDFQGMIENYTDSSTIPTTTELPATTTTEEPTTTTTEPTFDDGVTTQKESYGTGAIEIKLYTMSPEVAGMVKVFMTNNPDMSAKYTVTAMICQNTNKAYETRLNAALTAGGAGAPDIYVAESDYILPYTKGAFAQYAAPYSDFIDDFSGKMNNAELAKYTVELGMNNDGKTVALAYQNTGGAMIYSASIAKDVFGTDDPAVVQDAVGGGTGNWNKFLEACKKLNQKGYAAVADIDDIWNVCSRGSNTPWVVDGALNIDPVKDEYFDVAKQIIGNNWSNETGMWSTDWYDAMDGKSKDPKTGQIRKVFAFFGPAWLINYSMAYNAGSTRGDWRVCQSPVSFWWGGSWIFANKDSVVDADKKEFISRFFEWVTLDTSDTGLQYMWAAGLLNDAGTKDTVSSAKVLSMVDGSMDFLGGQNAFPIFLEAGNGASSSDVTEYDAVLNSEFAYQAESFALGKTKDRAIADFKEVCASMGIRV